MSNLITYILILILTFIFTYVFDVKETYLFFYMILFMPVVDYLLFFYLKSKVSIKLSVDYEYIEKNKNFYVNIAINNKSIIPITMIKYSIIFLGAINKDKIEEITSIGSKEFVIKDIEVNSIHIGLGRVEFEEIEICSLFNLYRKKLDYTVENNEIRILPNIVELIGVEKLIEEEFNEQNEEDNVYSINRGEIGCEYKEYQPGDPLNRVNWKLSSKRNNLIVRKDTVYSMCSKEIIVDLYLENNDNFLFDRIIESSIGMAYKIFYEGYDVSIVYKYKGKWMRNKIKNEDDIIKLQKNFSSLTLTIERNRFVDFIFQKENEVDYIIIGTSKDSEMKSLINKLKNYSNSTYIVSNNKIKIDDKEFYLNEDYSLERI